MFSKYLVVVRSKLFWLTQACGQVAHNTYQKCMMVTVSFYLNGAGLESEI